MHVRTHTSVKREREFRQACVYGGGLSGVYQGETVWKGGVERGASEEPGKSGVSPAKKSSRRLLLYSAIKIEIGRNRPGNALITPVFTHLRRFLSEITSEFRLCRFAKCLSKSRMSASRLKYECECELREMRDAKFHGLLRAKIAGAWGR